MAEMTAYKMIPKCTKDEMSYVVDELVRCKDCKYCSTYSSIYAFCIITEKGHEPDWFCADGKKKE